MQQLRAKLEEKLRELVRLEKEIRLNLKGLGYIG
jgi:hypothetical protein